MTQLLLSEWPRPKRKPLPVTPERARQLFAAMRAAVAALPAKG